MTIAQALVNRETTKTLLMDDGFNKHAFNDKDGLPSWFLDDEMKHFRSNVPVTKEAVEAIRAKLRALNARPIKKVAEAKARKKMRAFKRIANAQRKAESIIETEDITEKEKAAQISRIVSRATKAPSKKKKDEVKIVVARGATKGVSGRPKGIKGKYKMVDSRGKKEMRALKRIKKRDGPKRKKN
jgi:AdoMet-dependent rRNA methyltransferase SPB1